MKWFLRGNGRGACREPTIKWPAIIPELAANQNLQIIIIDHPQEPNAQFALSSPVLKMKHHHLWTMALPSRPGFHHMERIMQRRIFHDCPMWLTVLLLLFLCGCSATRLGYQNADWFLKRGLSDYIDFNDTQTQYLDKSLTQLMEWHCQTQLPRYIHWLERVEQTATTSPVSRNEVSHRVNELRDFLQDIAFQITPPTTALLSQLSDRQITQLSDRITTRQLALEKKHLTPSLEKQAEQRAKRLEKRLKRWLGPLTTEQRERIRAWS